MQALPWDRGRLARNEREAEQWSEKIHHAQLSLVNQAGETSEELALEFKVIGRSRSGTL